MKKTCYRKLIIKLFFAACLILFNISCGLDTFYVVDQPTVIVKQPLYNSADYNERYFEFYTNEHNETNGFNFQGTNVYYRIYDNYSRMNTEVSSLQSIANDTENSSSAPTKLMDTYKYQMLTYYSNNTPALIPYTGENKKVYIRLSDYQSIGDYCSRISFLENVYIPIRNVSGNLTFNFGRSGKSDKKPVSGDNDFSYTGSSDGKFYVAMFAVAIGTDATFAPYYSNILYLGSVTIDSNSPDN